MIDGYQQFGFVLYSAECKVCNYRLGHYIEDGEMKFKEDKQLMWHVEKQEIVKRVTENHALNESLGTCDKGLLVLVIHETVIVT